MLMHSLFLAVSIAFFAHQTTALTHTGSSNEELAETLDFQWMPELENTVQLAGINLSMSGIEIMNILTRKGYACDFDYDSKSNVVCTIPQNLGKRIHITNRRVRTGDKRTLRFGCSVFSACQHAQVSLVEQMMDRADIYEIQPKVTEVWGTLVTEYCGYNEAGIEVCVEADNGIKLSWEPSANSSSIEFD